jgi:hypothetical protein
MPDESFDLRRCLDHEKTLDSIVGRVQKLVDEFHQQNVVITGIQGNLSVLCDRVPVTLHTQLSKMETELKVMQRDVEEIKALVRTLTSREDFVLLRTQWYSFIALVATSVVAAILALVFGVKGSK